MPQKKQTMCPECYLMGGHEVPLDPPRAGAQARCPHGHTWDDMELLQQRIQHAKMKRAQVEGTPQEESPEEKKKKVEAMQKPKGDEVVISQQDYMRLSEKLGDFPDGATLFGKIHSLMMDKQNLQEQLDNELSKAKSKTGAAISSAQGGAPGVEGGDMLMEIRIPEQHVQPIKDIAEATGTSSVAYVNSIVENGLNNGWFY